MKYYNFNNSDNLSIIGHYPQTSLAKGYNPIVNNGHRNVEPDKFPDFLPNYELDLHSKANATDFLPRVGPGFGMVVNNKFKEILANFKLPNHHFYKMKVYQKNQILDYYWLHYIVDDFWGWLDREQSEAVIFDHKKDFEVVNSIDLNLSLDEIKKLKKGFPYNLHVRWNKIVFKKGFSYDLYQAKDVQLLEFISEDLKNALKETNITGIDVKLNDKIFVQI